MNILNLWLGLTHCPCIFMHTQGFEHHVQQEHNMWAYVLFFINIDDKEEKDYTSLEKHAARLVSIIKRGHCIHYNLLAMLYCFHVV